MGFAERLSMSMVTDTLEQSELKTMPVDFVGAMTGATAIGSNIFRAADGDMYAFRRAMLLLTKRAIDKFGIGRGKAQSLAQAAICEALNWQCRKCNGAGEVVSGQIRIVCPRCGGTSVHRWSDKERASLVDVPFSAWHKWEKRYFEVLAIASNDYSRSCPDAKARLG